MSTRPAPSAGTATRTREPAAGDACAAEGSARVAGLARSGEIATCEELAPAVPVTRETALIQFPYHAVHHHLRNVAWSISREYIARSYES